MQPALPGLCSVHDAVEALACAGTAERGAIFTRPEVVNFILDLVGYTADKPLHQLRLLEPSFGGGDFLLVAVGRLLESYRRTGRRSFVSDLGPALRAVELHHESFGALARKLSEELQRVGIPETDASALCDTWLIRDDFLLASMESTFTHIVGNPPYVRQEVIPQVLIDEYRRRYATIYDRADLYVPFIERSLSLLASEGVLGFICADRWTKNRYGAPLRKLVSEHFNLRAYIDMVDTPAFTSDVVAYPAIFVIGNERAASTRVAARPRIEVGYLSDLAKQFASYSSPRPPVAEVGLVVKGAEPWILEDLDGLKLVRRLEERFPTLEEANCKVGIGVATGADSAFIGKLDELDVEPDRKLPLAMTRDISSGVLKWRGLGVVNPFASEGGLVDLEKYPRLKQFLESRKREIAGRHIAQKMPANWYRTIDRIYPELVRKPKLLIPDIKGEAHIVLDEGACYPHHNLYYITSESWDLRALQAVLISGIARLFVSTYSTKMRGGYLRFQAQYLRRIRVPRWEDVPVEMRQRLVDAGMRRDLRASNLAVAELYDLSDSELTLLAVAEDVAA